MPSAAAAAGLIDGGAGARRLRFVRCFAVRAPLPSSYRRGPRHVEVPSRYCLNGFAMGECGKGASRCRLPVGEYTEDG